MGSLHKPKEAVTAIHSTIDFKKLKTEWNLLVEQSTNPHPFISWEWLYTWWETYQDNNTELYILTIYEANKIIAIAPFYLKHSTPFIRCLRLLGEGEKVADEVVTHYPDIIVQDQHRDYAVSTFSKYLKDNIFSNRFFSYASFKLILENSVIRDIGKKLSSDLHTRDTHLENQFIIKLPEDADNYIAGLSKSTRKQFRMKLGRIKKAGDIEIRTEHDLASGLKIIENLHRERWKSKSDQCVFDSAHFSTFHRNLCKRYQQKNIINFRIMYHNNQPIAATYNLNYGLNCYSYLSGFKSTDDKRLSPMFVFDILEIKNLISNKYMNFDLLASEAENNYKLKYGSEKYPVYQLLWLDKGFIATATLSFLKFRPYLAKAYHWTQGKLNK